VSAKLYAVPTPLGGAPADALPAGVLARLHALRDFVAERPKSARAFLAAAGMPCSVRELRIETLDEHTPRREVPALLAPLRAGRALGLLSEAGCPAIADPGAALIEAAHREGFAVVPLVGPSAITLALMASGLDGQRFAFAGYLPRERAARLRRIRELEARSRLEAETEIFIETPYRNDALLAALLEACQADTRLCVAADLTLPGERVATRDAAAWRRSGPPEIGRRPAVFLLRA
jgi:16S rRNA (cytidine1402-2'-O)-methyltransferase